MSACAQCLAPQIAGATHHLDGCAYAGRAARQHRPAAVPGPPAGWRCECGWTPAPRVPPSTAAELGDYLAAQRAAVTTHCLSNGAAVYLSKSVGEAVPDLDRPADDPCSSDAEHVMRNLHHAMQRTRRSRQQLAATLARFDAQMDELEQRIAEVYRVRGL